MKFSGTALSDAGISKRTNQDSVCLKIADIDPFGQAVLAVVCDGVGGLEKGEVASATVVRKLSDWFERELPGKMRNCDWQDLAEEWCQIIENLNNKIQKYGKMAKIRLGTTLSALLVIGEKYMIVHVGDSRIYRIRKSVEQLTRDQTFVEREVKRGKMTQEQAALDSRRNILLQCIGASQKVVPEILFGTTERDSVYLVCSDGFCRAISESEMLEKLRFPVLKGREAMEYSIRCLMELIKSRRETDNISAILLKCTGQVEEIC